MGRCFVVGAVGAMTTLLAFEFPTLAVLLGLAGFMLARLLRLWPEGAAGTLAGAGAVCLLIGLLNSGGGRPCPASPATSLSDILAAPDGQASSCGGVAPLPLLAAGSLSLVLWHQRGLQPAGQRLDMETLGLYRVGDGKFAQAQMFYFDTAAVLSFLQ
jgi:hypothetical protein